MVLGLEERTLSPCGVYAFISRTDVPRRAVDFVSDHHGSAGVKQYSAVIGGDGVQHQHSWSVSIVSEFAIHGHGGRHSYPGRASATMDGWPIRISPSVCLGCI